MGRVCNCRNLLWVCAMSLFTTLKDIRAANPCGTYAHLLEFLEVTATEAKHCTNPLPVLTVMESNGVDDALWVIDNVIKNEYLSRCIAADMAEMVLHIFEAECPNDDRPRMAIQIARNPNSTRKQLAAAEAAAWDAARAARAAARAAVWAAVGATARASRASVWAAARASRACVWAAARAARVTEQAALREKQEARLRQYLENGIAAKDMEWAK